MGQKLSKEEADLYKIIDEILHYKWDPIGISGEPGARDEYYSYLPKVYELTKENPFVDRLGNYLNDIASNEIGLTSNFNHCLEIANLIQDWVKSIRK